MAGIAKLQESIVDIGEIVITSAAIAKNPKSLSAITSALKMMTQALELLSDLKSAVPEAKDLDPVERAALGTTIVETLQKVLLAVGAV